MKFGISANALGHGGGMERHVRDLVRGLAARGIKPVVFTRRLDTSLPESRLVELHSISDTFLPGKLRDHWFSWRLREARRLAAIDVLIGCTRADSADICICGGTHLGFLRAIGRRPKWSDHWQIALERRYYAHAKIVVAHSKLMGEELQELYGVPGSKICLLYPPIDSSCFTPVTYATRLQLRHKYGFGDDEVVLLFPSSSHERKGLATIEGALEGTSLPIILAVAGRPLVGRTPSRVRYLGFVEQIEECYQAADFTILASRYEPFGMVGVETVLCGTPAILSSRVGALEVIAPRAKFTFDPDDVAGLQGTIARAVQSLSTGQRVSRADLLYDPSLSSHIDSLFHLAQRIRFEDSNSTGPANIAGNFEGLVDDVV